MMTMLTMIDDDNDRDDDNERKVCAYGNNQHELSADVTKNPDSSSFRRAMELCQGTVSVVDKRAIVYTRIWYAQLFFLH